MSNWSEQQFTRKGAELRAKVEAGKCKLALTKMKIGNGSVAVGEIEHLTDLKSPQLVFGISSCTVSEEDSTVCKTVGIASSSNVENSFSVSEMGLYATDPDIGEILYLVCVDSAPDIMPNKRVAAPVTLTYQFDIVTSNTANVTAMITPTGLATAKMVNEHRTVAELDHPEKSVKRKHLADNVYTLPAPEATNAVRFVGGDHKVRDVTPGSIGAYSKNDTNNLLAQKAPLASPALTGTPTVPTAGRGTNNGQIASTAFVAQAITALVNSAPGALDTLQELAAALGNDANFAATITNALAGKLGKTETAVRAYDLVGWTLEHNRSYAVGDIAYHKNLPSWARLECVTAGTTGSNANVFSKNAKAGQYIIDGGVRWIVDDVRDCNRVGSVTGSLYLPDGYVKANGATVSRADYPRLVALADRYNLWTDNIAANTGMFGRGDGAATMVLPNLVGMFMRFVDAGRGAGSYESDAVQDHGHELMECYNTPLLYSSNAVTGGNAPNNLVSGKATPVQGITPTHKHPNPRIADETRPKNIGYIPIIRY